MRDVLKCATSTSGAPSAVATWPLRWLKWLVDSWALLEVCMCSHLYIYNFMHATTLQVLVLLLLTQLLGRGMALLLPMLHAMVLRMHSWTASLTPHTAVSMAMTWLSDVRLPVQVSLVVNQQSCIFSTLSIMPSNFHEKKINCHQHHHLLSLMNFIFPTCGPLLYLQWRGWVN